MKFLNRLKLLFFLTDLRLRSASCQVLLAHSFLDAVDFILVSFAVTHRAFLGLLQRRLESFHTLHRCSQSLLQLWQFTAQVGVITHQLLVHLRQLLQVVLQEGNLLLLGQRPAVVLAVLGVDRLLDARLQILNEQFTQIVQGLQLLRHGVFQPFEVLAGLLAALVGDARGTREKQMISRTTPQLADTKLILRKFNDYHSI